VNGRETAEWLLCCAAPAVHYRRQVYLIQYAKTIPCQGNLTDCHHDADGHLQVLSVHCLAPKPGYHHFVNPEAAPVVVACVGMIADDVLMLDSQPGRQVAPGEALSSRHFDSRIILSLATTWRRQSSAKGCQAALAKDCRILKQKTNMKSVHKLNSTIKTYIIYFPSSPYTSFLPSPSISHPASSIPSLFLSSCVLPLLFPFLHVLFIDVSPLSFSYFLSMEVARALIRAFCRFLVHFSTTFNTFIITRVAPSVSYTGTAAKHHKSKI